MGTFPAAQSLLSPAALLELVVSAYDVGRPVDCWLCSANFSEAFLRGNFSAALRDKQVRPHGLCAELDDLQAEAYRP